MSDFFLSFKEVTLKIPGRTPNRVVKTHIREHEAWKLQQVKCGEIFSRILDHLLAK